MKNLLLLLLLANVLYFLWGLYGEDGPQPGTAIIEEADLGPPLYGTTGRTGGDLARAGTATRSAMRSQLEAVVGRSCVTIGPFQVEEDANSVALAHSSEGKQSSVRSKQGKVFVGHWVQIRNITDSAAAKRMLAKLNDGGLKDAYLVRTEDEGLKISLGLFGEVERAERTELQARSMDLPADISPRMVDRTVYFVDIGLPPGQGAGAIVEKYGEDKVLLRKSATCPK
jgi:hypothetical protein